MFKNKISKYYMGNSIIHKLNPLFKIILLILILIMTMLSNSVKDILLVSSYLILLIILSKINIKIYLINILNIKVLLIFLLLISFIFNSSILYTVITIYKIIAIIIASLILTLTTPPTEITYGLEKILYPFNKLLKTKEIAISLMLALRFIPSITNQSERIIKAISVRGVDFNKNIIEKVKNISILLVPIFTLSIKKADYISDIMNIRLYNYSENRTNYRMNEWQIKDTIVLIISILLIVLIILERK